MTTLGENITVSDLDASNDDDGQEKSMRNLWMLFLVPLPIATIAGNALITAIIARERSLRSPTNYLLISLAISDMLMGISVMPPATYLLVNNFQWTLSDSACNLFILFDVASSTASILNLVAVSIERFYAVVLSVRYRRQQHHVRIRVTICLVWLLSFSISFTLLLLGNDATRTGATIDLSHQLKFPANRAWKCEINNTKYMFYASILGFFAPCLVILVMYSLVFYSLHRRMQCVRRKELTARHIAKFSSIHEMIFSEAFGKQTANKRRKGYEWNSSRFLKVLEESACAIEEDDVSLKEVTELATIIRELEDSSMPSPTSTSNNSSPKVSRKESNTRSAYQVLNGQQSSKVHKLSYALESTRIDDNTKTLLLQSVSNGKKGYIPKRIHWHQTVTPKRCTQHQRCTDVRAAMRCKLCREAHLKRKSSLKDRALLLIMKLRNTEGQQMRKEARATTLVAAVLVAFLMCWLPFFTLNVLKSFEMESGHWNNALELTFHLFTWLGYLNSCLNPVVYSLANRQFRQKLVKLIGMNTKLRRGHH